MIHLKRLPIAYIVSRSCAYFLLLLFVHKGILLALKLVWHFLKKKKQVEESSSPKHAMSSFKHAKIIVVMSHVFNVRSSKVMIVGPGLLIWNMTSGTWLSKTKLHWKGWMFSEHLSTTWRIKPSIHGSTTGSLLFWFSGRNMLRNSLSVVVCVRSTQGSTLFLWLCIKIWVTPWFEDWANQKGSSQKSFHRMQVFLGWR